MKLLKIIFIFLIIIFFTGTSYSQDYEPWIQKAMEFYDSAQYDSAAIFFEEALPLIEEEYGKNDTSYYSKQLNYTAEAFKFCQQFDKAEKYYLQVKSILEANNITNDTSYVLSLSNVASIYIYTGNYDKAEPLIKLSAEIDKNQLGEDHPYYAMDLLNLAYIYLMMGRFEESESSFIQGIEINKRILGENHPDYIVGINSLAALYQKMGRYEQAEPLMKKVLEFDLDQMGEKHPHYGPHLSNLAFLYDDMGRYEEAEILFKKSLEITKNQYGENNFEYSTQLNNLALLYKDMGRYDKAKPLMIKANEIDKIQWGQNHPKYASSLNNLALIYQVLEQYESAEKLYIEALSIEKSQLGEMHPQYGRHLGNLAGLYRLVKLYKKSDSLYKLSLEILKYSLGVNHPQYASYLTNLAKLYFAMDRYEESESLILQAIEIDKKTLGMKHPSYASHKNNLANLYLVMDKYSQVNTLYQETFKIYQYQIKRNTGFLSQVELKQFFNTFLYYLEIYQSFNNQQIQNQATSGSFAYDIELTRKGILLKSSLGIKNCIFESKDTSLINAYYDLRFLNKKIDKQTLKSPEKRTENIAELETKANELEKTLTLKSKDYKQDQIENEINWYDVKKSLLPGETAIEFSSFHYYNGKESTDSILYCAIVLRNDDTIPQMIYLCEESDLRKAIPSSGATNREINYLYDDQTLYKLAWQPFDKLLEGINTIYFAPSGLLNSVSIEAIPCPDGNLLMDKYNLVQLSSTRNLAIPAEPVLINDAVVYGGIKYDTDSLTLINIAEKYNQEENDLLAHNRSFTGDFRGGFQYLPGSQEELESIAAKLEKKDIPFTSYSGKEAIEESFISLSGNNAPSVIHLSTHGFYFPDTVSEENRKNIMYSSTGEIKFRYNDDPLMRSGLLMAGANLAWQGKHIPENVEDGILTAKEVSNMNLMKTELVVLSACQSGLGDVKGSEGVEGLQRGFKMAGVRYIIMSLWQVPDKETTEFMVKFYDHWLGGKDIHEAFHHTQKHMHHKYKDDPFKWAGFVLME